MQLLWGLLPRSPDGNLLSSRRDLLALVVPTTRSTLAHGQTGSDAPTPLSFGHWLGEYWLDAKCH